MRLSIVIYFFSIYNTYGVSAGKRDQIEIFFRKKFLSKIDVDLIIWSRTFVISKKKFLSIWSLFPALTPIDIPLYIDFFKSVLARNDTVVWKRLVCLNMLNVNSKK